MEGKSSATVQRAAATQKCLTATGAPPVHSVQLPVLVLRAGNTQQTQFAQHTHKNCPSREAQVRSMVRTAHGGEDKESPWCLPWQFGEIKTERQNLGSDPFQGRCFSCEGQAAAPTGAGSTQCTGSSHCRPLLSHSKCNTWSCAELALPTPATPNSPCDGRRLQTASPYLSKITGRSHRRVNTSHSKKKILSLELKK